MIRLVGRHQWDPGKSLAIGFLYSFSFPLIEIGFGEKKTHLEN